MYNAIFLSCCESLLSHFLSKASNVADVIHALLLASYSVGRCWHHTLLEDVGIILCWKMLASYSVGRCWTFRKHLGDLNLPTVNNGCFSVPTMFTQTSKVIFSALFSPVNASPAAVRVFSGNSCHNKPVSSALNTLLASLRCRAG